MTPVTDVTYTQSWTIAIKPGPGEQWPDLPPDYPGGHAIQPDVIFVYVQPGQEPVISGSGIRRKRDGSPGALRVNAPWHDPSGIPGWIRRMAKDALKRHGLDGRIYHVAIPLRGSVKDQSGPTGEPVTSGRMPHEARYPLTAICSGCHGWIQLAAPDAEWLHTAVLPDWMRAS